MSYDDSLREIVSSLSMGLEVESPSWDVPELNDDEIRWIASWLASEGFGKKE